MTLLDQLRENLPLILMFWQVVFGGLLWKLSKVFASKDTVTALATKHDALAEAVEEMRIDQRVLFERLANLPTTRDLADLRATTSALSEAVPRLDKSVQALGNQVHLLTENELQGARK